jgi:hypothetical protein
MGLDAGFNCYSTSLVRKKFRERLVGEYYFWKDYVLNDAVLMAYDELCGSRSSDNPIVVTGELLDMLETEFIEAKEFCASGSEASMELDNNVEPYCGDDFDADFYLEMIDELRERLTQDQRIVYWFDC